MSLEGFHSEEWAVWCHLAPKLIEALNPVFQSGSSILSKRVHRNAIFALYNSRRERFIKDALVVPDIENADDVFIYWTTCETCYKKNAKRNLQYQNLKGQTIPVWPIIWRSMCIVGQFPQNTAAYRIDWEKVDQHPIQGSYARALAKLIAIAMHQ
ncbi:hypothetical protein IT408_00420 [Candidatus Uhrbacteria bacterium]|nr:hypothetical protein [Candidatus Uhrbacteria bacterium]